MRITTYFFNSKILRTFLIFIFVMFALFPVTAFANEDGKTEQEISILDKDNYYTDKEKEDLIEEIRKEDFLQREQLIYVAPVKDETSNNLSFQGMIDKEYPELEVDGENFAIIAPWLVGKDIGVDCVWRVRTNHNVIANYWQCDYIENPKGAETAPSSEKINSLKEDRKMEQGRVLVFLGASLFIILILLAVVKL